MKIRIIITGRAYHAAANVPKQLELPAGATLDDALAEVAALLGADAQLPSTCLIALAGTHAGTLGNHENRPLTDGDEITLVAPVAGG